MTQNHQVAILVPLAVGVCAFIRTIFVHALALAATVNLFRHEKKLGRAGASALIDLTIVALVISFAFVAHLVEIALWAVLLVLCGEFQEFGIGYYFSAVNYTTLGYGDLLLSPSWRLLGPLEATNGARGEAAHLGAKRRPTKHLLGLSLTGFGPIPDVVRLKKSYAPSLSEPPPKH